MSFQETCLTESIEWVNSIRLQYNPLRFSLTISIDFLREGQLLLLKIKSIYPMSILVASQL